MDSHIERRKAELAGKQNAAHIHIKPVEDSVALKKQNKQKEELISQRLMHQRELRLEETQRKADLA